MAKRRKSLAGKINRNTRRTGKWIKSGGTFLQAGTGGAKHGRTMKKGRRRKGFLP